MFKKCLTLSIKPLFFCGLVYVIKICKENSIFVSVYTTEGIVTEEIKYNIKVFNNENNYKPNKKRTHIEIVKDIYDAIKVTHNVKEEKVKQERLSITEINELLADLEHQMYEAAKKLDFEHATILRDSIIELKAEYKIK